MSEDSNGDLKIKVVRLEEKLSASNTSLVLAREAIEKRLEGMNEFRHQLDKQAATFITRGELWATVVTITTLAVSIATLVQRIMGGVK